MTNQRTCTNCPDIVPCLGSWGNEVVMIKCAECGKIMPLIKRLLPKKLSKGKNGNACWRYRPGAGHRCLGCTYGMMVKADPAIAKILNDSSGDPT